VAEQEVHAKCHELHALIAQRAEYEKRLDEFYSMVSHDIRSPMCSIVATMQFVTGQVGAPLGEVEVQLLRDSQVAASQVVGLVSDYLDHKKIAEQKVVLEKSQAKASEIVGKAHAMLRGLAQQSGVEVVMQNDESELVCNENAMVRVMVNLLTNAIKFTPEGKRIHLQARRVWDTTKDGQGFVEFVVADEGVGMTESTLAKVFEPFSVTTPSHVVKGSGLGMAIVKQLLEQHEAAVDVVSKPDVGTRVSFVLPSV
jgi:two-component system cell cycle sensor histidine kinase PleC